MKKIEETRVWEQQVSIFSHKDNWEVSLKTNNSKRFECISFNRKNDLIKDLDNFWNSKDYYNSLGISWTRGYLFYGIPGCGKTSAIKAISLKYKLDVKILNLSDIYSDEMLRNAFSKLPNKCLLLLEDVDTQSNKIHNRDDGDSELQVKHKDEKKDDKDDKDYFYNNGFTLGELLNQLDGFCTVNGRIVIMTTNHVSKLDPALIRPGRIDFKLEFKLCKKQEIKELYEIYIKDKIPDKVLSALSSTPYFTGSEISQVFLSNRLSKGETFQFVNFLDDACKELLEMYRIKEEEEVEFCKK